jgi:hypothetical protein
MFEITKSVIKALNLFALAKLERIFHSRYCNDYAIRKKKLPRKDSFILKC